MKRIIDLSAFQSSPGAAPSGDVDMYHTEMLSWQLSSLLYAAHNAGFVLEQYYDSEEEISLLEGFLSAAANLSDYMDSDGSISMDDTITLPAIISSGWLVLARNPYVQVALRVGLPLLIKYIGKRVERQDDFDLNRLVEAIEGLREDAILGGINTINLMNGEHTLLRSWGIKPEDV